ncbi:MAG: hypothetical protein L3K09_07285, partial [Thermoplasmata archaeon]|nr:hypothetical protein [Thermoplasmata archaeon]
DVELAVQSITKELRGAGLMPEVRAQASNPSDRSSKGPRSNVPAVGRGKESGGSSRSSTSGMTA